MNKIYDGESFGGVEKYTKNLIDLFLAKNYKIDFLYINDLKCEKEEYLSKEINYIKIKKNKQSKEMKLPKNKILNIFMSCFHICLWQLSINKNKNFVDNYIKKNKRKYFLMISNIPFYFSKKTRNLNNFILIQHTNFSVYDKFYFYNMLDYGKYSLIYKSMLIVLNKAVFFNKNVLQKTKNVVFFSNDKKYLEINENPLVGSIPMEVDYFLKDHDEYLSNKNNKSILYFGRFDNASKNLDLLFNIAQDGNLNIHLYGDGEYKKELEKNCLLTFKGEINSIKDKINILSKYDIFLLTSNYEGLPIASVELLSMGIIGIIRNSFLEAKNLIPNQYHNILLINSNADTNEYIKKINHIKNMPINIKNQIRINLINHIKKNFSNEVFIKNWNNILKKY